MTTAGQSTHSFLASDKYIYYHTEDTRNLHLASALGPHPTWTRLPIVRSGYPMSQEPTLVPIKF